VTERLLTAHEVAERLGVSHATVLDYAEAGDLPAFRLRGRKGAPLRFRWSEIEATIDTWRTRKADAPGREVSPTRTGHARQSRSLPRLGFLSSPTVPLNEAAPDEKE
jgi:excisionase family DNA binding protein